MSKINKQKPWIKEEFEFLKNNFMSMSNKEMGRHLSRGIHSINKRMAFLKLNRNSKLRKLAIGQKFGKLKIVEFIGMNRESRPCYKVVCDCGSIRICTYKALITGNTVSCGCKRRENWKISQYGRVYRSYIKNAKNRNLSFNISFDFFMEIVSQKCYYCDEPPHKMMYSQHMRESSALKYSFILINGIDRLKHNTGYIKNNCVPCCPICNFMKQEHDDNIFLSIISKIYKHHNKKNGS